jgi:aminoglycoside phosphotransferase family enzyme/predicted kinase
MSIPRDQEEVAAFLRGLAGSPPVETHISAVFVGLNDVWKLKKSVRLPYLDFSIAESRHHFLQREFALNRVEAPEIYRGVCAVERGGDGTLVLREEADAKAPVDWVLRMAPIPRANFLDAVAERHALTTQMLDALGDCVVRSHQMRAPVPHWDSFAALKRVAGDSVVAARSAGLPEDYIELWSSAIEPALAGLADWLASRAARGCVRRCHGDLHLGNLCLWRNVPVPFDALEFDEDLATIDIGYDLAFLLMDLDLRVSRSAANRVLNRIVARTGDTDMLRGLPVFMSLRAMVRAYVKAASGEASDGEHYLTRAVAYLRRVPPVVVAIGGLQGTGKSTLARRVAPCLGRAPGALVVRSDELRKRSFGVMPEQHLPPAGYTEVMNAQVSRSLVEAARVAANAGQAVIADATFLDTGLRAAIRQAARDAGCAFVGIWLSAPRKVLEERVRTRRGDASDATLEILRAALAADPGPIDWHMVDAVDADAATDEIWDAVLTRA